MNILYIYAFSTVTIRLQPVTSSEKPNFFRVTKKLQNGYKLETKSYKTVTALVVQCIGVGAAGRTSPR